MNNHHHHRELETPALCDFHPRQVIVGICPLCLKERLIILAAAASSKQDHNFINPYYKESMVHHETATSNYNVRNKSILALKIYALRSFLHRHLEFRKSSSDNFHAVDGGDCRGYESTSQEDSFISIKFQDNEVVSWDKGTKIPKEQNLEKLSSDDHINFTTNKEQTKTSAAMNKDTRLPSSSTTTTTTGINKNSSSVVEHVKSHAVLKWRKRIGQLFQITRWKKRSSSDKNNNKTSVNHVMINKVSSSGRGVKMRKGNGKNPNKEKKMGEM